MIDYGAARAAAVDRIDATSHVNVQMAEERAPSACARQQIADRRGVGQAIAQLTVTTPFDPWSERMEGMDPGYRATLNALRRALRGQV